MSNLTVFTSLKILDKRNRLVSLREFESKSLLLNFSCILSSAIGGIYITMVDVNNNSGGINTYSFALPYCKATGSAVYPGICFGTGGTAAAPANHVLQTLIAHGNSSGQLAYSAHTFPQGVTTAGNATSFIIGRLATNNSGGTINVTEMGLVVVLPYNGSNYLIIHDVFTQVPILTGHTCTGQYTFQITT